MSNWTTTTNFHCHFINPSITCNTDRQYSRNITSKIPVTGLAKHFLTEHMLNSVLEHTNKIMNYLIRYLPDNFNENRLYPFVKLFSFDELMAFSGFFFFFCHGLWHQKKMTVRWTCSNDVSSVSTSTMPRNRFCSFLNMYHLLTSRHEQKNSVEIDLLSSESSLKHSASNAELI